MAIKKPARKQKKSTLSLVAKVRQLQGEIRALYSANKGLISTRMSNEGVINNLREEVRGLRSANNSLAKQSETDIEEALHSKGRFCGIAEAIRSLALLFERH